jgi:predicted metal-dependent hydrolase
MADLKLLSNAADLFNRKLYFECHELLEDAWREALGEERQFLQGLIMLSVAMYHVAAENYVGAVNLFEKGLARLEPFLPERDGLDLEGLTTVSRRALAKASRGLDGEEIHWMEEDIPSMRFRS